MKRYADQLRTGLVEGDRGELGSAPDGDASRRSGDGYGGDGYNAGSAGTAAARQTGRRQQAEQEDA